MLFSISSLLAIATSASALSITPRADYGSWDFNASVAYRPVPGDSMSISATYKNSELAAPIEVNCPWVYDPEHPVVKGVCDDPTFSYDLGNPGSTTNITLKQTVPLWGENVTVTGTKEFHWDFTNGGGNTGIASGNIPVDSAVA